MRIISRISTTLSAALDRAVGSIENHDAVLEAAFNELQRTAGGARARKKRIHTDGERMSEKIRTLEKDIELWAKRAVESAENEDLALECLQRRRDCQRQISQLVTSREQLKAVEQRLNKSIEQVDQRMRELHQQRNVMRSRQSAAEASVATKTIVRDSVVNDIDRTLERWDAQLLGIEASDDFDEDDDGFERHFIAEEDRAALRAELELLKNGTEK